MILNEPTSFFNQQQEQQYLIRQSFIEYTSLLSELIESIRTENNKTRQHLFAAIQYLVINLNRFLPFIVNRDTGEDFDRIFWSRIISSCCLECETTLISLLLISFEVLRSQMGTELITTILQTAFSAFNMFVLIFRMNLMSNLFGYLVIMFEIFFVRQNQMHIQLYQGKQIHFLHSILISLSLDSLNFYLYL